MVQNLSNLSQLHTATRCDETAVLLVAPASGNPTARRSEYDLLRASGACAASAATGDPVQAGYDWYRSASMAGAGVDGVDAPAHLREHIMSIAACRMSDASGDCPQPPEHVFSRLTAWSLFPPEAAGAAALVDALDHLRAHPSIEPLICELASSQGWLNYPHARLLQDYVDGNTDLCKGGYEWGTPTPAASGEVDDVASCLPAPSEAVSPLYEERFDEWAGVLPAGWELSLYANYKIFGRKGCLLGPDDASASSGFRLACLWNDQTGGKRPPRLGIRTTQPLPVEAGNGYTFEIVYRTSERVDPGATVVLAYENAGTPRDEIPLPPTYGAWRRARITRGTAMPLEARPAFHLFGVGSLSVRELRIFPGISSLPHDAQDPRLALCPVVAR
jgi:hypothetical protein